MVLTTLGFAITLLLVLQVAYSARHTARVEALADEPRQLSRVAEDGRRLAVVDAPREEDGARGLRGLSAPGVY